MNQAQARDKLNVATLKLKRAAQFAEHLLQENINPSSVTTLWQLSGDAHASINALKSEIAGNEPPKYGG